MAFLELKVSSTAVTFKEIYTRTYISDEYARTDLI